MQAAMNPAAPRHIPGFVTGPGETDFLLYGMAIFLVMAVTFVGVLFLRLHHLPEHIVNKGQKIQFKIVAVLALISMLTHNNTLWIAALLLALIPIPDYLTPLTGMAHSLARIAKRWNPREAVGTPFAEELHSKTADSGMLANRKEIGCERSSSRE